MRKISMILMFCAFAAVAYAKIPAISLVQFNSNTVPEEFYKPDPVEKLPLDLKELIKMKKGGVDDEVIADAVEKRKVIGATDADSMIAMKKAGMGKDVMKAVQRYALPKNRDLDVEFTLEFVKPTLKADPRYLYIIFEDGSYSRIIYADLERVLQGKWRYDDTVDLQDPVLTKTVRTIRFFGNVTLKDHGKKSAKIILSKKPNVTDINELPVSELSKASAQEFEYPAYSLLNDCRLKIEFAHDVIKKDEWDIKTSLMTCEFD